MENKITTLLYQLLFNPLKVVKGIELINYDKDKMDKFYYFSSIILLSLINLIKNGIDSIGVVVIGLILFPIIAYANRWVISFVYYILFRFIGKIEITFEIVKITLYPVIALEFFVRLVLSILFAKVTVIAYIIGILSYLWLRLITFWIMIYKMKQTAKKGIILTIVLMCFEAFIFILFL